MGVIDADAMLRAGFAGESKGINPAADAHNRFWEGASTLVGNFAQKKVEQSFENLQEFRRQTSSQVAELNQMAAGEPDLLGGIKEVKKRYDKGARMAALGLTPQRRANGREMMAQYMGQLQKMSQYKQIFAGNVKTSKARTTRLAGGIVADGTDSTARHNPGNTESQILNTTEQANGRMKKLMRWDVDKGQMMIMRGGEWRKNEQTGEEQYVPYLLQEAGEWEEVEGTNQLTRTKEMWSELQEVAYDDLQFGGAENNLLQNKMTEIGDRLVESATDAQFNAMWEIHEESLKSEIHGFLNSEQMDEWAFKDFYFGGFSYDYSNNRMTASAPAFQLLLEQDKADGKWTEEDGWKDGYGPGTNDWVKRLEILKRQDFTAGSKFRTEQEPKLLKILTDKYNHARRLYENYEGSKPSASATSSRASDRTSDKMKNSAALVRLIDAAEEADFTLSSLKTITLHPNKQIIEQDGEIILIDVSRRKGQERIATIDPSNKQQTRSILENHSAIQPVHRTEYTEEESEDASATDANAVIQSALEGTESSVGVYKKPPNVTQEKWDSFSDLEKMNWYLQHGGK